MRQINMDRILSALYDALPYAEDVLSNPAELACFKPGVVARDVKAIRAAIDLAEVEARIAASAPDLLAALQRLVHPAADDTDLENALDVIARATGAA